MHDVVVVGSGPSGAIAGLNVALSGKEVMIVDHQSMPRYKACGGGVVGRAFKLLPASVRKRVFRETVSSVCTSAVIGLCQSGHETVIEWPQPLIYMVMRAEFDNVLLSEAVKAGAKVITAKVNQLYCKSNRIVLETDQGEIESKFVIGADGAKGICSRLVSASPIKIPAVEYEIDVGEESWAKLGKLARFDFEIICDGYAWSFPKDKGHLSMGILTMNRRSAGLHKRFLEYLDFLGINDINSIVKKGHLIPLRGQQASVLDGRVLLVGDAFGCADSVTAEGISGAILSGMLAGDALNSGFDNPREVASLYRKFLRRKIINDQKLAYILARGLYGSPNIRRVLLAKRNFIFDYMLKIMAGEASYLSGFVHFPWKKSNLFN